MGVISDKLMVKKHFFICTVCYDNISKLIIYNGNVEQISLEKSTLHTFFITAPLPVTVRYLLVKYYLLSRRHLNEIIVGILWF